MTTLAKVFQHPANPPAATVGALVHAKRPRSYFHEEQREVAK
jgi:hypothetical protein